MKSLARTGLLLLLLAGTANAFADDYYVILGSFSNPTTAEQTLADLQPKIGELTIIESPPAPEVLYRIALGPFQSSYKAEQAQLNLIQAGLSEAWTYTRASTATAPVVATRIDTRGVATAKVTDRVSLKHAARIDEFVYESPVLKDEIEQIVRHREQQILTSTEILATKEEINQLFVSRGYVNSGMIVPDQEITDGSLQLDFIAGSVTDLTIESDLRQGYIEDRLDITEPFNLFALQQSLRLLEQDPQVARIDAEVLPGVNPGDASIKLSVDTVSRAEISFLAANNRSPSIGAENAEAGFTLRNLTGWGETYQLTSSVTEGLDAQSAYFHLPLSARGASLELKYALSDSSVIEEPFNDIDVDSETESASLVLNYPIYRSLTTQIDGHLTVEARRNETRLLGQRFSFSEGAINGESKVAPVRFAVSYLRQNPNDSLAARISISRGTSNFDASDAPDQANGIFTSNLAQIQYSRRLSERSHFTLKALSQHASDPLLSVEKFALGGLGSVRGYRQNQVVRDNALLTAAEYHYKLNLPIHLTLVTFAEWGEGENHDDASLAGSEDLGSIGVGLMLVNWHGVTAELYLARAFDDFEATEHDLQDDGVHFRLEYRYAF